MVHTTIRAAILIASKCQVYPTKDGQFVRGCGLSTSTFLRGRPQIPYVILSLNYAFDALLFLLSFAYLLAYCLARDKESKNSRRSSSRCA